MKTEDDNSRMNDADFEAARQWFYEGVQMAGSEYRAGLQLALAFMRGQRAAATDRDVEIGERRHEGEKDDRTIKEQRRRVDELEKALRDLIDATKYAAPEVLPERVAAAEAALEVPIPF